MAARKGPSPPLAYAALLQALYGINLYSPVKLGLQNMLQLNALLGDPLKGMPVVHVTGTNGKGSVSTKVANCLQTMGLRTGLFTSPHISSFRERVQVDGSLLTCADVEEMLPHLFSLCQQHKIPATFFEVTTALAFMKFRQARCDAVVLEVGLGGRLDATNIVTPALSVITSVQLDHTQILGNTLELIAREKAGIIKPGVGVIVGPGCPEQIIAQAAARCQAPLLRISSFVPEACRLFMSPEVSDTDDLNTDLAHAALLALMDRGVLPRADTSSPALQAALRSRPICRFETFRVTVTGSRGVHDVTVVLDIAHNVDALAALVARSRRAFPAAPIRAVVGMSADKDSLNCMRQVRELVRGDLARVHCTEARHPRAIPFKELRQFLCDDGFSAQDRGDIPQALLYALAQATGESAVQVQATQRTNGAAVGEVVVVCGSAFLMSQARATLGLREPRDGEELQVTFHSAVGGATGRFADAQESFARADAFVEV